MLLCTYFLKTLKNMGLRKRDTYFLPYGLNENDVKLEILHVIDEKKLSKNSLIIWGGVLLAVCFISFGILRFQAQEIDWKSVDADSVPDYALASAGKPLAKVYYLKKFKSYLLPIPDWFNTPASDPRTVLEPWKSPGECWSFEGQTAIIRILLSHVIVPKLIVLEHPPANLNPAGHIKSAPRDFTVHAVDEDLLEHMGDFQYTGEPPNQSYLLTPETKFSYPYRVLQFTFHTNHGQTYTCVYKIRVHGVIYTY